MLIIFVKKIGSDSGRVGDVENLSRVVIKDMEFVIFFFKENVMFVKWGRGCLRKELIVLKD